MLRRGQLEDRRRRGHREPHDSPGREDFGPATAGIGGRQPDARRGGEAGGQSLLPHPGGVRFRGQGGDQGGVR